MPARKMATVGKIGLPILFVILAMMGVPWYLSGTVQTLMCFGYCLTIDNLWSDA